MLKSHFLAVALLLSSCGLGDNEQAARSKVQSPLIVAAQSVSLEFPLQFDAGDAPPGYTKVGSAEGRNESPEHLISALVLCSPGLSWIEKTDHTVAFIMPSDENAVWNGIKAWRPSDKDVIACIKQNARQPFFYRKLPNGIETYNQS
jgi:hypothetical protein